MRFRKLPVEIEAYHFSTNNEPDNRNMDDIVAWVKENGKRAAHNGTNILLDTLEGVMQADVGDWIIKGVAGEFYPCKPDILKKLTNQFNDRRDPSQNTEGRLCTTPGRGGLDRVGEKRLSNRLRYFASAVERAQ